MFQISITCWKQFVLPDETWNWKPNAQAVILECYHTVWLYLLSLHNSEANFIENGYSRKWDVLNVGITWLPVKNGYSRKWDVLNVGITLLPV